MIISRENLDLTKPTHRNLLRWMTANCISLAKDKHICEVRGKSGIYVNRNITRRDFDRDHVVDVLTRVIANIKPQHKRFIATYNSYMETLKDIG